MRALLQRRNALVLFGLLLVLCAGAPVKAAYGQAGGAVEGTVYDARSGDPVPGASVLVKGTSIGTATGPGGEYAIDVPNPREDSLQFSFVGYEAQTVAVSSRAVIDVQLQREAVEAQEVVVVGYTTQQSESVTGAVSRVTAEDIADRNVGTLEEALKGRVAGVEVRSSGEPGENAAVLIRGASFIGSNSPLYVVDGVYTNQNPSLDPQDVASIQVLKDASATAQYGAQAANGVIVIETKKGTSGETRINAGGFYGSQSIPHQIDMAGPQEWARITRMAYENANEPVPDAALHPERYANTDWQDELFQRAPMQKYNLGFSGGSENSSYRLSGGYLNQDGTIIESSFKRYNLRVNSELSRGLFTVGESASLIHSNKENPDGFPLIDAVRFPPTVPVRDSAHVGGYGYGSAAVPTFGTNPVGFQRLSDNTNLYNQVLGNLYVEAELLDELTLRISGGGEYADLRNEAFRELGRLRRNNFLNPANLGVSEDNTRNLQGEAQLTYDDVIGSHAINATLVYREARRSFERLRAYRQGFPNENKRVINAGGTESQETNGFALESTLRSFLARANYDYDGRYLFTGSLRRDGSSRFGPNNRWGTFLSGSAGWVVSEEPFYDALPVLGDYANRLKLRASYGEVGNDDIGDYAYSATITPNLGYTLGPDGRLLPGATQVALANPNIKWQENQQTNIGLDLGLFDDALTLTAEYYISTSQDLLVAAPLPLSLGTSGVPTVNAGSIENRGFELTLGQTYESDDFRLHTSANLSTVNNEVLSLGNNNQPIFAGAFGVSRTAVGGEVGELYVLKTDGLFQSEAEVQNHTSMVNGEEVVIQPEAEPGDIRFADLNGDGIIGSADRYSAGSAFADFEGGFSLDAAYKNVDFSLGLRGSYGSEIFNAPLFWTNRLDDVNGIRAGIDPWTPDNRDTDTPRALSSGDQAAMNATAGSDRWIEDGSYLRIQNIELGYTLPSSLLNRAGWGLEDSSLRVYVSAENLYTLTGYSNWDPTIPGTGTLSPALDDGQIYPASRTLTVGLDLNL